MLGDCGDVVASLQADVFHQACWLKPSPWVDVHPLTYAELIGNPAQYTATARGSA